MQIIQHSMFIIAEINSSVLCLFAMGSIIIVIPHTPCYYWYLNWEWDFVCLHCVDHNTPQNMCYTVYFHLLGKLPTQQ